MASNIFHRKRTAVWTYKVLHESCWTMQVRSGWMVAIYFFTNNRLFMKIYIWFCMIPVCSQDEDLMNHTNQEFLNGVHLFSHKIVTCLKKICEIDDLRFVDTHKNPFGGPEADWEWGLGGRSPPGRGGVSMHFISRISSIPGSIEQGSPFPTPHHPIPLQQQ